MNDSSSIYLGYEAGLSNAGYASSGNNTTFGYRAGRSLVSVANNPSGFNNTVIGALAMLSSSYAQESVAIGYQAMATVSGSSSTIPSQNVAIGNYTLNIPFGNQNTAIGYKALYTGSAGVSSNVAIGAYALLNGNINSVRFSIASRIAG